MKQSYLTRGLLAACALAAAVAVVAVRVFQPVADVVLATCRAVKNLVLDGFTLSVQKVDSKSAVVVAFVQAKAFVLRIIKRDRPLKEAGWNLTPSV
jgi:membrane-bound lytic murein transglycosylase B